MICTMAALVTMSPVEAKTFKIATISPDGLGWMKQLRSGAKEINLRTEGRIKFKIYPGGVMGDDYTVLRKIRIGQLHGGILAASSLTSFYPDLQVYNLPLQFRSNEEVDYVRQRMDERIVKGLYDSGVVSFTLTETGFAYLLTKKPISSVAELRKSKMWVPSGDPIAAKQIQSFGISPIPLPITDVLAGLQTGLIDAVMVPPIVALALQWNNHVEYVTNIPIMYIYSMLTMDKRAFNSMAEADQNVVREVMDRIFQQVDADSRADNDKAYAALLTQGLNEIRPQLGQLESWRKTARASVDSLVASHELSQESVDLFLQYLDTIRSNGADTAGE